MIGFGVIEIVRTRICCFSELVVHVACEIGCFVEVGILIYPLFLVRVKQLFHILVFLVLPLHLIFSLFFYLHLKLILL